eukprot:TRINITY_DN4005_c0_g2_i1.p2 TRINITY_DN4005_c0_g2~~TRINITY_DN4005_c0_g2_i1.p2  ORF type:complete len:101 (-),score=7.46 TRINITY_DN4005_c0_g2_i1:64-366(-)
MDRTPRYRNCRSKIPHALVQSPLVKIRTFRGENKGFVGIFGFVPNKVLSLIVEAKLYEGLKKEENLSTMPDCFKDVRGKKKSKEFVYVLLVAGSSYEAKE